MTRDMKEEELQLLQHYGTVIKFEAKVYTNVPIQSLQFDYFILDIRNRDDRYYLQQIDANLFHFISVCYSFEKYDDYHKEIGVENIMSKLPEKQAFKQDFNRLLLQKKISKPAVWKSCIKSFIRVFKGGG